MIITPVDFPPYEHVRIYRAKQSLVFEGITYTISAEGMTHADALARAFDCVVYLINAKTNDPQRQPSHVHP